MGVAGRRVRILQNPPDLTSESGSRAIASGGQVLKPAGPAQTKGCLHISHAVQPRTGLSSLASSGLALRARADGPGAHPCAATAARETGFNIPHDGVSPESEVITGSIQKRPRMELRGIDIYSVVRGRSGRMGYVQAS